MKAKSNGWEERPLRLATLAHAWTPASPGLEAALAGCFAISEGRRLTKDLAPRGEKD